MLTLKLEQNKMISIRTHYIYKDRCKAIPGSFFNYEKKLWMAPLSSLKYIQDNFYGEIYYQTPQWIMEGKPEPPKIEIEFFSDPVDVPMLYDITPYNYQKFGMQFCIDRIEQIGFAMVGDAVGLGKTIEATGVIKHYKKPGDIILIICKKSIKSQWLSEIKKLTKWEDVYCTGDTPKKRQIAYDAVKNGGVLITNYNNFLNDFDILSKLNISFCVIDEAHCVKGRGTKRNTNIGKIINGKKTILLTGTPIMSCPDDIWGIVNMASPGYLGSYYYFEQNFLVTYEGKFGRQIVGAKNLDRLQDMINTFLIKRSVYDVQLELPDNPDPIIINVEMDNVQKNMNYRITLEKNELDEKKEAILANNELTDTTRAAIDKLNEEGKKYLAAMQFIADDPIIFADSSKKGPTNSMLRSLIPRSYSMSPKTEATLDLIDEIIDSGEKVIIFCHLASGALMLHERLLERNHESVMFTGAESDKVREKNIELFKNDVDILIGTEACAEGLNLQFARCVIHYEQADTFAQREQRIGRVRRIGSSYKSIVVYDIITENSFDETKYAKLKRDKDIAGALVGL